MADLSEPTGFAFLQTVGPRERRMPSVVVTVVLAAFAGLTAGVVVGALVTLVAAGITASGAGLGLLAAINILSDGGRAGRSLDSYVYELALVGGASLAAAVAFIAVASRRAGRPVRTFLTATPRFRWRQSVLGLAIFLPVVAAEIWLEGLARPPGGDAPLAMAGASLGARFAYAAAALGFLWCAALAEEILFRGWLLQQTRAFTRSIAVIVAINAAAFSLAHGDPSVGGLVTRFALGVGWAWIVLRLNGVEFAAGAHLANNLGIALLAQPVLLTQPAPQPFEPLSVALQIGATAALVVGVEWWVRRNVADGPGGNENLGERPAGA
jgi:membrane protease YdiL (CAAX protease family)